MANSVRDEVNQSEVLDYIHKNPTCNQYDIADALNVYPFVVERIIELLVGCGAIRKEYNCLRSNK